MIQTFFFLLPFLIIFLYVLFKKISLSNSLTSYSFPPIRKFKSLQKRKNTSSHIVLKPFQRRHFSSRNKENYVSPTFFPVSILSLKKRIKLEKRLLLKNLSGYTDLLLMNDLNIAISIKSLVTLRQKLIFDLACHFGPTHGEVNKEIRECLSALEVRYFAVDALLQCGQISQQTAEKILLSLKGFRFGRKNPRFALPDKDNSHFIDAFNLVLSKIFWVAIVPTFEVTRNQKTLRFLENNYADVSLKKIMRWLAQLPNKNVVHTYKRTLFCVNLKVASYTAVLDWLTKNCSLILDLDPSRSILSDVLEVWVNDLKAFQAVSGNIILRPAIGSVDIIHTFSNVGSVSFVLGQLLNGIEDAFRHDQQSITVHSKKASFSSHDGKNETVVQSYRKKVRNTTVPLWNVILIATNDSDSTKKTFRKVDNFLMERGLCIDYSSLQEIPWDVNLNSKLNLFDLTFSFGANEDLNLKFVKYVSIFPTKDAYNPPKKKV